MPRFLDDWRHYLAVSTYWLARIYIVFSIFNPLTALSACIIALLYLYLLYEHMFNSGLVAHTPPLPDDHLPSRAEWLGNGGLKRVSSESSPQQRDVQGGDNHDETCIICYEPLKEPTKISPCGHVFCRDCIDKWHSQGQRSCPQCTIKLWRQTRPSERTQTETLELEPLVKFTAAATIVFVPLNLLTLYACLTYNILDASASAGMVNAVPLKFLNASAPGGIANAILLIVFILVSALQLTLAFQGYQFMMQRRREQGTRWWGGSVDAEEDQPYRMAFTAFSQLTAWWVAVLCQVLEAHTRGAYGDISAPAMVGALEQRVALWLAQ